MTSAQIAALILPIDFAYLPLSECASGDGHNVFLLLPTKKMNIGVSHTRAVPCR